MGACRGDDEPSQGPQEDGAWQLWGLSLLALRTAVRACMLLRTPACHRSQPFVTTVCLSCGTFGLRALARAVFFSEFLFGGKSVHWGLGTAIFVHQGELYRRSRGAA